jgi:hypothetical protein
VRRGCITWCRGEAFAQRRPFVGDMPSNGLLVLRTLSRPVLLWLVRDDALSDPLRSSPCCCFHISGIPRLFPQGAWPGNTKSGQRERAGTGVCQCSLPGNGRGHLPAFLARLAGPLLCGRGQLAHLSVSAFRQQHCTTELIPTPEGDAGAFNVVSDEGGIVSSTRPTSLSHGVSGVVVAWANMETSGG